MTVTATMDTNALTRKEANARGWIPWKAETYNPFDGCKRDMYGVFDYVAISNLGIIGIQSTTRDNLASHMRKLLESRELEQWVTRAAQPALLWCWSRKLKQNGEPGRLIGLLEYNIIGSEHGLSAMLVQDQRFDACPQRRKGNSRVKQVYHR